MITIMASLQDQIRSYGYDRARAPTKMGLGFRFCWDLGSGSDRMIGCVLVALCDVTTLTPTPTLTLSLSLTLTLNGIGYAMS